MSMRVPVLSFGRARRCVAVIASLTLPGLLAGACGRRSQALLTAPADPTGSRSAEVDNADGIPVAGWEAGAVRRASAQDAWGGQRGDGAPLSDRGASYEPR